MNNTIALIFDCGATNIRVVAINGEGNIMASKSFPNKTIEDKSFEGGKLWDTDYIWEKFCKASKIVCSQIDKSKIAGVAITTFGVNGTLVDEKGELLYPVISWQCERTLSEMKIVEEKTGLQKLYAISGVYPYHFNTIFTLKWLKKHKIELFKKAKYFLFMPSLFTYKLTGIMKNDATMVGTAMLTNYHTQEYSQEIFESIGVSENLMGTTAQTGDVIGRITSEAEKQTGIPKGTNVFSAGHDTQFAIIGSGAALHEPVLSSGTWEILMTRSNTCTCSKKEYQLGITTEFDCVPNHYNIGINYIGSGLLEWIRKHFYSNIPEETVYKTMIAEAANIPPFCEGVKINPNFYTVMSESVGSISGLTLHTSRAHIYRATLEALAFKLKAALHAIEEAGNFKAKAILCVGGGSKNTLWNQIRADVCGIPIKIIAQKETTVLGAAMYVFKAAKNSKTIEEIQQLIGSEIQIIQPSKNNKYQEL